MKIDWHVPKKHPRPCRADGLKSLSVYIDPECKKKFDTIKNVKRYNSKELLESMIKKLK